MKTKVKIDYLKEEKGITLIALLVMIVILILLSAVVIRGVTQDRLIDTSMSVADEYNIQSYKEQIDQTVRSIILKDSASGKNTNIAGIAKDINDVETLWIKNAIASDGKASKEDVVITVKEGYAYEVYYDSTYGAVFTEYIGRDDGKGFPELNMKYNKAKGIITGTVTAESGAEIKSTELIYRGEVKTSKSGSGSIEFDVESMGTGWYIVKTTSSRGKMRYNWIRVTTVSEKLSTPTITVTAEKETSKPASRMV